MATVNPYLTFSGNCEEAFSFYKSVFGGDYQFLGRFKDMPAMGGEKASDSDGEKIMHVSLPIGKETVLMGSDTMEGYGSPMVVGTNFTVSVNTDSKEEADKIFNGLSSGGKVTMPMDNTFWGSYFGMLTDKFDIQWMVSFETQKQ